MASLSSSSRRYFEFDYQPTNSDVRIPCRALAECEEVLRRPRLKLADPALVADIVLLPAGPSPLDIMAARDALALTRDAREQRGGKKPLVRFVPSKVLAQTSRQGSI